VEENDIYKKFFKIKLLCISGSRGYPGSGKEILNRIKGLKTYKYPEKVFRTATVKPTLKYSKKMSGTCGHHTACYGRVEAMDNCGLRENYPA